MDVKFNIDLERYLEETKPLIVELGCGSKKPSGRLGIDVVDLPGVDVVADLEAGLPFLPDSCADAVYASHVLEHLDRFVDVMREIHRCLKPEGRLVLRVPHFSNPFFYSDFTHKRFFGLYSFDYLSRSPRFRRRVPRHYVDFSFKTLELSLVFYSDRLLPKVFGRALQVLVNSSRRAQEAYEELWSRLLPCSEIYAVLTPEK